LQNNKPEISDAETGDDDDDDDDDDKTDEGEDNDVGENADEEADAVTAAATEFVINCLSRAGDLTKHTLMMAMLSPRIAIVAIDNGEPILKLDADKAGDNEKLFADPKSLATAFNAILSECEAKKDFSGNPFASLGGVPLIYTIKVADEIKNRIAGGITAVTASVNATRTDIVEDVKKCLSIAGVIIARNADSDIVNPLRTELLAALGTTNIRNAETIIDSALEKAGEPLITALLTKARELLELPAASRAEISRFVEKTPHRRAVASDLDDSTHRAKFARNSIPLTTAAASEGVVLPDKKIVTASGGDMPSQVDAFRQLIRAR
jgi:hypothetical protein